MANDISLIQVKEFGLTKLGTSLSNPQHNQLRDLETLVNDMYAIRDNTTTAGCSSHGGEIDTTYYSTVRTVCSSHSKIYNSNDLSLGHFKDVFNGMIMCNCDSFAQRKCACVSYSCSTHGSSCDCQSRCGCQSRCSCNSNG